jgi:YVTN family beta-propeller protein
VAGPADRMRTRRSAARRSRRIVAALALAVLAGAVAYAGAGSGFGEDAHQMSMKPPAAASRAAHAPPIVEPKPGSGARPDSARRRRSPAGVYAGALPGRMSPAVRGVPERVYVPNSGSDTVTEIDPRTFRVVRTITTGTYDQHVTPSWDLRWLYVDDTASSTLTVLNPRSGLPVRVIPVTDPYNLYFTPDGSKAIVVAEAFQRIDFRNPHTWRLIKSVPIPSPGPDHLDFTARGGAFLISCEYAGAVYRVSTRTMRITGRVAVGGLPVDVKLSPDGSVFYVANQGLGGVTLISARTLRAVGFLPTGSGAHGLAISREGRDLYVANRLAGSISVIDFARRRVVATWHVGGSPDMLQVSPGGGRLWTSNRFGDSVSVIDTRTGRLIRTIPVGSSPHGLAFFPQPGGHSLGHNGVYR